MTPGTMEYAGETLYVIPYGPLTLVATVPLTAEAIDAAAEDDPVWERLGLLIDPVRTGNSCAAVAHEIELFMHFESATTGVDWDLDTHVLASRIYLSQTPVVVALWQSL